MADTGTGTDPGTDRCESCGHLTGTDCGCNCCGWSPQFRIGQQVTWTGSAGLFRRTVTIAAVRNSYLVIMGEGPEDGREVYDINDPVIGGIVFGIPPGQLEWSA